MGVAWGAKLIKSEMAQIVTHLPFWFWNLVSGEILSSCVQFFLFVLLISAHITIVEELCVPIRISHIQPTSYYYGSKALCFTLKYTALWLHNFLFLYLITMIFYDFFFFKLRIIYDFFF